MTAHAHDPAAHGGGRHPESVGAEGGPMTASRPRWLLPALVVAIIAGGLVVAGVVPLSTVLYAGLFGGMILMHAGGHSHGGHGGGHDGGGHGGGEHGGRGRALPGAGVNDANDLSRRSSGDQPAASASAAGLDRRALDNPTTSESDDHAQHRAHGCH